MEHELVRELKKFIYEGDEEKSCPGYTWIPEKNFLDACHKKGMNTNDVSDLVKKKKIICCDDLDGNFYFTIPKIHEIENNIVTNLMRLLFDKKEQIPYEKIDSLIGEFEKINGFSLHEQQRNAVYVAVNNRFCVITGGPGTGKTCVLNAIDYVRHKLDPYIKIRYCAPTGKAARRITESTGNHAETLHKLLGLHSETATPKQVEADLLIVDEVSMNDIFMTEAVLSSIMSGHELIFVGDTEQLPSVGPGAVLRDLIDSEKIPVAMLTKTFRQDNSSKLFENIGYIKKGYAGLVSGPDFELYPNEKDVIKQTLDLYLKEVKTYGINNVCLLTPMRKSGETCSEKMNREIQAVINPMGEKPYLNLGTCYYQVGDLVMQLKNRKECANGDVGTVTKVEDNEITVDYGDIEVIYKPSELEQITLAYAMTIHKSQGSEYKSVISLVLPEHGNMLQRNLFYTAVTRAKKKFVLIYDENALENCLKNRESIKRVTFLKEKIVYLKERYDALGYAM